jgi:hypothetical protein
VNVGAVSSAAYAYSAQGAARPQASDPATRPPAQDKIELSAQARAGDVDHDGDSR